MFGHPVTRNRHPYLVTLISSLTVRRSVAALCALLFAAHVPAQSVVTVKIGFASPLTGPQAHYGQDNLNGARMAIDELNSGKPRIGGKPVRFELVVEDDQADPRTGTVVAQR